MENLHLSFFSLPPIAERSYVPHGRHCSRCPSVMCFNLDLISDMKPLSSFLESSWKFLMFFIFCLMVGYALYYSSFTNNELSDIWQSEPTLTHPTIHTISHRLMCTPKTKVQVAKEANLTTQAVRTDTFNTTKSPDPKHQVPLTEQRPHCNSSSIKSWKHGVVTQFFPLIKRNCSKLIAGSQGEVYNVRQQLKVWKNEESDAQFIQRMSSCANVVEEFSNNFYVSSEEKDFPLAFIFVVYTNARQVVRLLKAIYRPHNLYCIHPDARQGEEFARVFRQISKCLDNVFVASKLINVYYQHHTIMDSQLNCMEDLLKYEPQRWKYVINLCGRELPLKTNREIVSSLKRLKGASAVDSVLLGRKAHIWEDRFTHKIALNYTSGRIYYTSQKAGRPPHHIQIYKSFNFIAATRPFVDFILHSRKAIDFRNYLKELKIPEEHFYASLGRLPEAPGGYPKNGNIAVPVVDQYIWLNSAGKPRKYHQVCEGKPVHFICILTVGDLPEIYRLGVYNPRPHFFFNKYFMEDDHVVMDCMEERLVKQNMLEYKRDCG